MYRGRRKIPLHLSTIFPILQLTSLPFSEVELCHLIRSGSLRGTGRTLRSFLRVTSKRLLSTLKISQSLLKIASSKFRSKEKNPTNVWWNYGKDPSGGPNINAKSFWWAEKTPIISEMPKFSWNILTEKGFKGSSKVAQKSSQKPYFRQ